MFAGFANELTKYYINHNFFIYNYYIIFISCLRYKSYAYTLFLDIWNIVYHHAGFEAIF